MGSAIIIGIYTRAWNIYHLSISFDDDTDSDDDDDYIVGFQFHGAIPVSKHRHPSH